MQIEQQEKYEIRVERAAGVDSGVLVTIDGEPQVVDAFEFAAPLGTGFAVRKITRVELVPELPKHQRGF